MAHKPPTYYAPDVRRTLHWLVPDYVVNHPLDARAEAQYLLCHAVRLHESLTRLPAATAGNRRCLVVGSWGIEVPYLVDRLGWLDVTCICAPSSADALPDAQPQRSTTQSPGISTRTSRAHPNENRSFEFNLIEHDLESGPMPFEDETFGLVVFWGCFEHLRHDPEYGLYEINRVVAPDGCLSLVTDNAISFQMTHSVLRGSPMPMRLHHPAAEGHWRLYTPPEIGELLDGTGWQVRELTSIVSDPPVYWRWWKRWLFRKLVADYRMGFGLPEPYWNAFVLAQAVKVAAPTRRYPTWLYKDEKIRALRLEMQERENARCRRPASHRPLQCAPAATGRPAAVPEVAACG